MERTLGIRENEGRVTDTNFTKDFGTKQKWRTFLVGLGSILLVKYKVTLTEFILIDIQN